MHDKFIGHKGHPLYCKAYTYDAVKSENTELLNAIGIVESHRGDKGIHAIDRAGGKVMSLRYIKQCYNLEDIRVRS